MRIAIDYTAGIRQNAGIGIYVRKLMEALLSLDQQNQYMFLTSGRPTQEHPFPTGDHVHGRSIGIPDRYLNILWYRFHLPFPPPTLLTGKIDLYHGPDFVLPPLPRKLKKVVTIHDLAFLEHPEYAVPSLADYLRRVVPRSVEQADIITTVSHEVNRTLIKHFQTPEEKLRVVPNGVGSHFHRITDPVILGAMRNKFTLEHPFVLSVGTLEPRKNHQGLIKAFHQLQGKAGAPAMLAIAGGQGWLYDETKELVARLKLEKKVRFLGKVSEFDLVTLYSLADVFAFPSFAEGFGIPPLEAMACGLPVVTSNRSALPEVVGDAALLVDPEKTEDIAEKIQMILTDPGLHEDLRQRGYERVKHYSWQAAARKLLHIYQELSGEATTIPHEAVV